MQHAVFKMFRNPKIAGCLELISPKINIVHLTLQSVVRKIYNCRLITGSQGIVDHHVEYHVNLRQIGMPRDKNVACLQTLARRGFFRL